MKHTPNILYEKNNILYGTYTKTLSIQFGENLRKKYRENSRDQKPWSATRIVICNKPIIS